jgi:hypothetical protein
VDHPKINVSAIIKKHKDDVSLKKMKNYLFRNPALINASSFVCSIASIVSSIHTIGADLSSIMELLFYYT